MVLLTGLAFVLNTLAASRVASTPQRPNRVTTQAQDPIPPGMASGAGAVERLDLKQLTGSAQVIVLGTVESMKGAWDDRHATIYTDVTFSPERWLKGDVVGGPLIVRVPGGEIDGAVADVSDAPAFSPSEQAILFLQGPDGNARYQVVGGFQGKFSVENNRVLGEQEFSLDGFLRLTGSFQK